jgi:hypothetical protein
MNARTLSISLSIAGLLMLANANAHAGGYGWVGDVMGMGMGTSASGQPLGGTASEALRRNAKLSGKVAQLLPAGTDLQSASSGSWNVRQFVAAAHVTNNLGVPFDGLKQRIMGGQTLGEAVHALRPDTDAQVEARKARASAEDDIRRT